MNPDLKCHFVKQLSQYASRILYGYNCNMEVLLNDINTVIEDCKKQPQFGISKEF